MYYWSIESLVLFLFLGYFGVYFQKKNKIMEKARGKLISIKNIYSIMWIFLWAFFSAIRLVNSYGIGGVDAPVYKEYFEVINEPNAQSLTYQYNHYDILFRYICKVIRFFTGNYHIFFFIIYLMIAFGIIYFVNTFGSTNGSFAPFIMLFYVYLLGHNTIRTLLSISFILFGISLIWKDKKKTGIAIVLTSMLIQKTSALYVLILPFYYLYKKKKVTIKKAIIWSVLSAGIGYLAQYVLIYLRNIGITLGGAYADYSTHNSNLSFFDNFWKIAFTQLLLAALILLFNKQIRRDISKSNELEQSRLQMIWVLCIFDIITIPTAFVLNYWRGYEYFMPARLVMWSEILKLARRKLTINSTTKFIFDIVCYVAFLVWFVFRLHSTYEASGLMPYVIDFGL